MIIPASEYLLDNNSYSSIDTVKVITNYFLSSSVLQRVMVLDSIFLRNKKSYFFTTSNILTVDPNKKEKLNIELIQESCFNKGHLSILFAFEEFDSREFFSGFDFTVEPVDLGCGHNSPLSQKQVKDFSHALRILKGMKFNRVYCFSHDAEFMYSVNLQECNLLDKC